MEITGMPRISPSSLAAPGGRACDGAPPWPRPGGARILGAGSTVPVPDPNPES